MKVTPRNRRLAFVFVSLHWLWQLALQTMRKAKPNKSHEKKKQKCIAIAISLCAVQFVHCYCCRLETVCCISVWVQRLIIDDINHCALSPSVVDMSSVLISRLPTTTTTTPRGCIHKSMSLPRCCCCSARCVHCTCQLSLRFPLRLLVMDVPMPDHIQICVCMYWECV